MSLALPRQAVCADILAGWAPRDAAVETLESMKPLFEEEFGDLRDLARRIQARHPRVGADALRMIRQGLRQVDGASGYFTRESYAPSLRRHALAHRSCGTLLDALTGNGAFRGSGGTVVGQAIRDEAGLADTPTILGLWLNRAADRAIQLPLLLPLGGIARISGRIYAALCHQAGPADADRELADLIKAARQAVPGFEPTDYL